jgi:hypothetical protein
MSALVDRIEAGTATCDYCSGTGMKWQLPSGQNAFEMSIFEIARRVVRVPCHCPAALVRAVEGETR